MRHYNPWQEKFDRVCKEIERKSAETKQKQEENKRTVKINEEVKTK